MMELVDLLQQLLINPNIVYLFLVAGLLCTILAFTTPGTGLPEAGAVVFLALAAFGLFQLPTNIFGLALIVLSNVLFLAEAKWMSHGAFTAGGVITLVGGSLLLFGIGSMSVSLPVVGLTVLATLGFFALVVSAAVAMRKQPAKQNPDAVLGTIGEAKTDVLQEGTVQVGGELWTAESDETIPAGAKVKVLERAGLKLKVVEEKKK